MSTALSKRDQRAILRLTTQVGFNLPSGGELRQMPSPESDPNNAAYVMDDRNAAVQYVEEGFHLCSDRYFRRV